MTLRGIGRRMLAGAAFAIIGMAATAASADTITVTHWGGQFYGAPYAVAMEKGFFKQHGVDVTGILTAPGGGTAVRNTSPGTSRSGRCRWPRRCRRSTPGRSW